MESQLLKDFDVPARKVSVIPFGINNTTPTTPLTGPQARKKLGIADDRRVMLFFGQIAPYKGLEYLVQALPGLLQSDSRLHLVVAGKVKSGCESYWHSIEEQLASPSLQGSVTRRIEHVPDQAVEVYFKAADVLIIPYVHIFQSGVPFLAYSFGLPVIATDVGSLRDDIIDGKTGWVCAPQDPAALAKTILGHFKSALFREQGEARADIQAHANERHSWAKVANITEQVYRQISQRQPN